MCSRVIESEVDMLRIERVCAHQTLQQQSRRNEFQCFRRRGGNVILERAAFHYDQKIDYCADTTVKIREMTISCQYKNTMVNYVVLVEK